jgi:hypothetical protein
MVILGDTVHNVLDGVLISADPSSISAWAS